MYLLFEGKVSREESRATLLGLLKALKP